MPDATPFAAPAEAPAPRPAYLLASFGQRLRAHAIDSAILLVPTLGVWALLIPALIRAAGDDQALEEEFDTWSPDNAGEPEVGRLMFWMFLISAAIWLSYVVLRVVYECLFLARTAGQTPGRRAVGIRVMRADGQPVTFWWSVFRTLVVRELLFGAGALLSGGLLWFAQYLWPLWDDQRRALHDMVARSRVVQDAESA